jgi:conjugative transfer region protein (TIGR03748 family)
VLDQEKNMKRNLLLLFILNGCLCTASAENANPGAAQPDYLKTDRYTETALQTEIISPLMTVVNIQFSDNVKTVGEAILEALDGSGYHWNSTAPDNEKLMTLPLPIVLKEIGPAHLKDALLNLVGNAWKMEVDDLNRSIRFVVKKR